ncbi:PREDICTED: 39S ribosomal protein L14, mitochondrial isoform X3 [Ceratotherium simum simum]|uniref:Large ribosomal subunit protein uL14m n=2 Tax=Ceratotherium simum simum TaxID=73337 RepID=A0ABM1CF21_CERSS|nr:PREDICTED: 39S ribosomal protein L14, mitochondrial isoform X3 [Ceratotherium simum simum]
MSGSPGSRGFSGFSFHQRLHLPGIKTGKMMREREDLPSWDPMAFFPGLWGPFTHVSRVLGQRCFSTTGSLGAIQKMTRVRVVDNSALGNTPYHRPPRCIHVYNKNGVGKVGDRILLAIKGQKKKALIVGHRMPGPRMTPRFDSNNVVLIEDNGNPVGTRIKTPIPTSLRQREGEFSKVLAIAQNFV